MSLGQPCPCQPCLAPAALSACVLTTAALLTLLQAYKAAFAKLEEEDQVDTLEAVRLLLSMKNVPGVLLLMQDAWPTQPAACL